MKKFAALSLLLLSATTVANELSPANPILRPLTLKDGELNLVAGARYGNTDSKHDWELDLGLGYGLTDDFSIGLGGMSYRFLPRSDNGMGLELAVNAGLRGYYESRQNGDALGYGAGVYGKYVLTRDTAVNFGVDYTFWNEEVLQNKREMRYTVGVAQNLMDKWTLSADYTYRDLHDFNQNHAYEASLGLNYNVARHMDVGIGLTYTDFDAVANGYKADAQFKRSANVYLQYRF